MMTTTTLTRQELYALVWQTPMFKLAASYGLSGRGLAKVCERYSIPVPGRGHWASTRAGYKMERDPLPRSLPPDMKISITGNPATRQNENGNVNAQIDFEKTHPIRVADRLVQPHSLVARTKELLSAREPQETGTVWTKGSPLGVRVSPKQLPRALRIIDALLKACEERGFPVEIGKEPDARARVVVHGERLNFSIEERSKRSDHVLNRREEEDRRRGRGWGIPRYAFAPTGILHFSVDEATEGHQHKWSDREKRPLESKLNEIVVAMVRIAVTVLKPRHQRWEEEARRREEGDRRRLEERKRVETLNKALESWRSSQELRRFVAAVEKSADERLTTLGPTPALQEWLGWAKDLAERTDPLNAFVDQFARDNGE